MILLKDLKQHYSVWYHNLYLINSPFLQKYDIIDLIDDDALYKMMFDVEIIALEDTKLNIKRSTKGAEILFKDDKYMNLDQQERLIKNVDEALKAINVGKTKQADYKQLFDEYKALNKTLRRTKLSIKMPKLGLKRHEAFGFNIVGFSGHDLKLKGGITVIVINDKLGLIVRPPVIIPAVIAR